MRFKLLVIPCAVLNLIFTSDCFAQHNSIFLHQFFKDKLFDPHLSKPFLSSGLLPCVESEFDLNHVIRDSSKQYYTLTDILLKKHLFEIKGSDFSMNISPIVDISLGRDISDTSNRKLFQNTRGIYIEGDLMKNFSFSSAIYENQGRYATYQTDFYHSVGELYPQQATGSYSQQNAVIPGAARTKPFKIDGFDYAFATGNIVFRPHKSIVLSAGNTAHFIGDGYRSLLLSDNSVPAPFLRAVYKISDKLEINGIRMRLFNLIRRPVSTTVESYYESKGFSVNYLTYKPIKGLALSLFEGVIWSRGDSIVSKRVHPLFYSPIPGTALLVLAKNDINHLLGINAAYSFRDKYHAYGQLAMSNMKLSTPAFQIGLRAYNILRVRNTMFQSEYNHVPKGTYSNANPRLTYSHYNLPLATVRGDGYDELIVRINYEWKRFYMNYKMVLYWLKNFTPENWLPIYSTKETTNGSVALNQLDIGYRFNRKMNLCLFGSWQYRKDSFSSSKPTSLIFLGLRTAILNHYNDF
jgi:hypothetical protein